MLGQERENPLLLEFFEPVFLLKRQGQVIAAGISLLEFRAGIVDRKRKRGIQKDSEHPKKS